MNLSQNVTRLPRQFREIKEKISRDISLEKSFKKAAEL